MHDGEPSREPRLSRVPARRAQVHLLRQRGQDERHRLLAELRLVAKRTILHSARLDFQDNRFALLLLFLFFLILRVSLLLSDVSVSFHCLNKTRGSSLHDQSQSPAVGRIEFISESQCVSFARKRSVRRRFPQLYFRKIHQQPAQRCDENNPMRRQAMPHRLFLHARAVAAERGDTQVPDCAQRRQREDERRQRTPQIVQAGRLRPVRRDDDGVGERHVDQMAAVEEQANGRVARERCGAVVAQDEHADVQQCAADGHDAEQHAGVDLHVVVDEGLVVEDLPVTVRWPVERRAASEIPCARRVERHLTASGN